MFLLQAFSPSRSFLATAVGIFFSQGVWADTAGRVNFVVGEVTAISPDNKQRQLYKGDLVNSGDRLETSAKSRVQIRMTDGGFLALRPNSVFQIEKYSFSRDTPEQGALVFKFLKGGMRTLSGAIGKINRANYQFNTPMATIGIRGTDYSGVLSNDTLTVTVSHGQINLANEFGSVDIPEGQTFEAKQGQAPTPSSTIIEPESIETEEITETKPRPTNGGPLPSTVAASLAGEELVRPRLENFASYNQFLQAMYSYKKAEEERNQPKVSINGVPGPATNPELTPLTPPGGTGDIVDGGESVDAQQAGSGAAAVVYESDRFAREALLRSNFNNFPLKAVDGSDLRESSIRDTLNSGFNSVVSAMSDDQILKYSLAANGYVYMDMLSDRTDKLYLRLLQRLVATRFVGNQMQVYIDENQFNQVYISVETRTCR